MRPRPSSPSSRSPSRLRLAAAALLLAVAATLAPAPAAAKGPVAAFIEGLADEALRELAPNDISAEERERRFREMLRANFDMPRIARFVLGHHARRAGADEMRAFMALHEDLMTLTYARLFASYSGETFAVKRVVAAADSRYSMVMSELRPAGGGEPVALDWQVLTDDGRHTVLDLRVEGVSLAITQRDEFGAVLDRHDGDIGALLDELRRRIARLRERR